MRPDKEFLLEKIEDIIRREPENFLVNFSRELSRGEGYRPSFSHFEVVYSGELPLILPGEEGFTETRLHKNDILYLVPNAWVGRKADTERKLLVINLHSDGIECYFSHHTSGAPDGSSRKSYFTSSPLDAGGLHILKSFEHYSMAQDTNMQKAVFKAFLELIKNSIIKDEGKSNAKTSSTYKMLLQFMRDNCCSNINRQTTAHEFGLSADHITHLFQKYSDSPFNHVLQQYRMERAAEFLRQSGINIDQTAELCGYNQTSYFIKTFRRFYGMTPAEYRKNLM